MHEMVAFTVFVLIGLSYPVAADTGSADLVNKKECSLIDGELELLRKLLKQETEIRDGKFHVQNLTNTLKDLMDRISKLERNQNQLYSSMAKASEHGTQLSSQIDEISDHFNESLGLIAEENAQQETRIKGMELQLSSDTSSVRGRTPNAQNLSFCPANIVQSTGLVQTGYAMIDCTDIHQKYPEGKSGVYRIYPSGGYGYTAYCEMTVDGGGWTVFQRRIDGSVDFYRTWDDYAAGFGSAMGEHWLGNQALHEITLHCPSSCELRVDLEDFEGNRRYAKYIKFSIGSAEDGFDLTLGDYNGNAGDSLSNSKGMKFTTKDKDQDQGGSNCANNDWSLGAWWFKNCFEAHLNSVYFNASDSGKQWLGLVWKAWKGSRYSLKATRMMFRRDYKKK